MQWVFSINFRDDEEVELIGVEAGGESIESGRHAARFADLNIARIGVLHGTKSFVMQTEDGQIMETHSISAGLDYPQCRPRTRLAARPGTGILHLCHRRRSTKRLPALVTNGGYYSGP